MSFFSFGKKEQKGELSLVFHIGSSTVSAALFERKKEGNISILFSSREPITLFHKTVPDRMLISMLRTLDTVVHQILKNAIVEAHKNLFHWRERRVVNIGIILSGAWCSARTKIATVKSKDNEAISFTADFINSLSEKEKKIFEKDLAKDKSDGAFEVFEQKIIQTKLNGYEVAHPFGKKASELEVSFFMGVAPKAILEKIKRAIGQHFHPRLLQFHSFALASFAVIRDILPETRNFLLLHVSGELTDVSIIKSGVTIETISFPLGIYSLLRNVSKAMNTAPAEAVRSALKLHFDGKAEKTLSEKLKKALDSFEQNWLSIFNQATSSFSKEASMPQSLCLVTQPLYQKLFETYASHAESLSFGQLQHSFNIIPITDSMLESHSKWESTLPFDRALVIDSLFMDNVFGEKGIM